MERLTKECDQRLADLKAHTLQSELMHDRKDLQAIANRMQGFKSGDKNLDEHLASVISFLISHYPDKALAKLEEVSHLMRKNPAGLEAWLKTEDFR